MSPSQGFGNGEFWNYHFVILELQMLTKRARKVKSLTEPGHRELPGHAADLVALCCYHMYQVGDCCPSLTGTGKL